MLDTIILRLSAPLMSFGGVVVDQNGFTRDFPAASMLTGLLGNSMGYFHQDFDKLNHLQNVLQFAVRCDNPGTKIIDYQTVNLGQEFMVDTGWTTSNKVQERKGSVSESTHQRFRHYISNANYTIALTLRIQNELLNLDKIEESLKNPARPIFLGRKCCIPSEPLFLMRIRAPSFIEALKNKQTFPPNMNKTLFHVWVPEEEEISGNFRLFPVTDERDWANQIHAGRRMIKECMITLQGESYE